MPNEKTQRTATTEELRSAVMSMDSLAQLGFGRIEGIAKAALYALETPAAHRDTSTIAMLFDAIAGICDDVKNTIGCEAAGVGANYEDLEWERRLNALTAAAKRQGAVQ
jgi:hypothetical protein